MAIRNIALLVGGQDASHAPITMQPVEREKIMAIRKSKPLIAVLLVAGSLGAVSAHAEGAYLGGALGIPHFEDNINGITGNGSGLSGKVFGGYQFSPNFALEAGIANLGHIDNATGRADGHGEYVDAVGLLPMSNQWSLLASLGMAHINLNTANGSDSGRGLKLGLGAQYAVTSNVILRGEWERYQPHEFGGRPDIDQITFGVHVAF